MDLIFAEKPSAAKAIANALGANQTKKFGKWRVYYRLGENIVVASAAGHLLTLSPKIKERLVYPKFEYDWTGSWQINKKYWYIQGYWDCLKWLLTQFSFERYVIATDLDYEGTVIGFISLLSVGIRINDKVKRMKMNSLARDEIIRSYNELSNADVDWFYTGLTRHEIDFLYGINITEALTTVLSKQRKRKRTISAGRVQTPILSFVVKRELEIVSFVPETYWNLSAKIRINGIDFIAHSILNPIHTKQETDSLQQKITNQTATIEDYSESPEELQPPLLFNLSSLQQESNYKLHISPQDTDYNSQQLYQQALISYPRTDSTGYWTGVPYRKILEALNQELTYKPFVEQIIATNGSPRKGGYSDGTHSAIYPTVVHGQPSGINTESTEKQIKLLDLIKKRFIAGFYEPTKKTLQKIIINISGEKFIIEGIRTDDLGWQLVYAFSQTEDFVLPNVTNQKGQQVIIFDIQIQEKQTQPPRRFSVASLIREMERQQIGTKATRSNEISTLLNRGYTISEQGIKPTALGAQLIGIFQQFCPSLLDVQLTRQLEEKMEKIQKSETSNSQVVNETKETLQQILNVITQNQEIIGIKLNEAIGVRKNGK